MLQYHSHYDSSVLDGASKITEAIKRAKELGYTALGITDHGTGQGLFRFYKECIKEEIKPVLGCELYTGEIGEAGNSHLIAIAASNEGLENLFALITKANMENFYRKPRATKNMLKQYSKGIIFTSACLGGDMASFFFAGDILGAKEYYEEMMSITEGRFYLEIQPNDMKEQIAYNKWLYNNFKDVAKFTVNSDMHYVRKEDSYTHDTLLAMQVKKKKEDTSRFKFQGEDYYMMYTKEILCKLNYLPEEFVIKAIYNTNEIEELCNVELQSGALHLPKVENERQRLAEACNLGFKKRLEEGAFKGIENSAVIDRIKYELQVICDKGYASYFIIVKDFLDYAKDNNIYVGPGRGSVCGSMVAFVLGIHEIEPIKNALLFERFINPDRNSPPDVDSDFCYEDRNKVIEYIEAKYGKDHTAKILAEGTFTLKKALRDTMRCYGYAEAYISSVSKTIPDTATTFEEALMQSPDFSLKLGQIKEEAVNDMMKIEGMISHNSTHAAGIVITPDVVWKYVPCSRDSEDHTSMVTQWSKKTLEEAGVFKFDCLGLKLLTIFKKTLQSIKENKGIEITRNMLNKIDLTDPKIYEVLCSGNMYGIFQFEGSSAAAVVSKVKPQNFEDIVASESICRPGVKEAEMYIHNKNNDWKKPSYWDKVKHILESTYGAIVYQEQTMLLLRDIGGFTLGEADSLRKVKSLEPYRERFIAFAISNKGFTEDEANGLFDRFSLAYSFNKSHAAAYGLNTAICAYLKAYYPAEFMASVLSLELTKSEPEVQSIIMECRNEGITITPPNINKSTLDFIANDNAILMPLSSIAGVGDAVVESIIANRPFTSLADFLAKVPKKKCNKAKVINLIKGGAFSTINKNRSALLELYYAGVKIDDPVPFWCDEAQMMYEKEVYGFYLMKHPLDGYVNVNINDTQNGIKLPINAIIGEIRYNKDRNGNMMAFAKCENKICTFDIVVFSSIFAKKNVQGMLREGNIVKLIGKVDGGKLLLEHIEAL